ncbi:MAG: hypothetical protein H8E40_03535 [Chloroflexi bacterium]|nr:hypothetical protein [Chloroflexota bacterium]
MMNYELWIYDTDSGGENIDLTGNSSDHPFIIRRVQMPTPRKVREPILALDPEDCYEDREIRVVFDIIDADCDPDPDTIYDALSKINRLLRKAKEQDENEIIPTVEIRWKANESTYTTYFVLLGGEVDNLIPSRDIGVARSLNLTLRTKPFGRGVGLGGAPIAVPLDNTSGSKTTDPVTVYNHDDITTGHDDWVNIEASDLKGDQPALCMFKAVNPASPNSLYQFRIADFASDDISDFLFSYNAEGAGQVNGTLVDDVTAPGIGGGAGEGRRMDYTVDGKIRFNIPPSYSDVAFKRYFGNYMAILICCQRGGNQDDWRLRYELTQTVAALTIIVGDWKNPKPNISGHWEALELGVFTIPPAPYIDPKQSLSFYVNCDELVDGTTMSIAALYLFPLKQWLLYRQTHDVNYGLSNLQYIKWDNISLPPNVSIFYSTGYWRFHAGAEIGAIRSMVLDPTKNHHIGFLFGHWDVTHSFVDHDILDKLDVQCWYNPRYLHIRGS